MITLALTEARVGHFSVIKWVTFRLTNILAFALRVFPSTDCFIFETLHAEGYLLFQVSSSSRATSLSSSVMNVRELLELY